MGDKIRAKKAMRRSRPVPLRVGQRRRSAWDAVASRRFCRRQGSPIPSIIRLAGGWWRAGGPLRVLRGGIGALGGPLPRRARTGARPSQPPISTSRSSSSIRAHVESGALHHHASANGWASATVPGAARFHQKVHREAPAPGIPPDEIASLGEPVCAARPPGPSSIAASVPSSFLLPRRRLRPSKSR